VGKREKKKVNQLGGILLSNTPFPAPPRRDARRKKKKKRCGARLSFLTRWKRKGKGKKGKDKGQEPSASLIDDPSLCLRIKRKKGGGGEKETGESALFSVFLIPKKKKEREGRLPLATFFLGKSLS